MIIQDFYKVADDDTFVIIKDESNIFIYGGYVDKIPEEWMFFRVKHINVDHEKIVIIIYERI